MHHELEAESRDFTEDELLNSSCTSHKKAWRDEERKWNTHRLHLVSMLIQETDRSQRDSQHDTP